MDTPLYNVKGEEMGRVDLPEGVFGLRPSTHFLHEVVKAYLSNQRRGTACAKKRDEVSGGGRKPWRQKHTGRARAGSTRSPLWRKGGVVFGPRPRSYRQDLPRAKVLLALGQALSAKQTEGRIQVLDEFKIEAPKTKLVVEVLRSIKAPRRTLLVLDRMDPVLKRASRNIPDFGLALSSDLNAYAVLRSGCVVLTQEALKNLAGRLLEGMS